MKIVAIIQARLGSSRLPNKVMMPVRGKPLLGWMLDRMSTCEQVAEVIVATTLDKKDDSIAAYAQSLGFRTYRGSENDLIDRYYQAACLVQPDAVVRITADCPLLDPRVVDELAKEFSSGNFDFLSNSEPLPSSWPDGMDVSIMTFNALKQAWSDARKPSEREHVTFYFWNNPQMYKCKRIDRIPDWSKYRITVDYIEDFNLVNGVINQFEELQLGAVKNISMEQIVEFLEANPDLFELNKKYTRGLGWQSSLSLDKMLGF